VADYRLVEIDSLADFQAQAARWNALWQRSDSTLPTARAELAAAWVEHFAPGAAFRALVVEHQGQWVAGLPLVEGLRCGWLRSGRLPVNEWSTNGDLLIDPRADQQVVGDQLAAGLRGLAWPLVWLDEVPVNAPRWRVLLKACDRAGVSHDYRPRWQVPVIPVGDDWEACRRRWSKRHRNKMTKAAQRLAQRGRVHYIRHTQPDTAELPGLVRRCFEVEDRSWKGESGTSVLRNEGMLEFFTRQAELLARYGHLELALLQVDSRPVGFIYGFRAKGVSYWHKIGYDPEFQCSTPGLLVQCLVLEELHGTPGCKAVDCMGPLSDALAKWRPETYEVGRLIAAPRSWIGRAGLCVCKHLWPRVRDLLPGCQGESTSDVLPTLPAPPGPAPLPLVELAETCEGAAFSGRPEGEL